MEEVLRVQRRRDHERRQRAAERHVPSAYPAGTPFAVAATLDAYPAGTPFAPGVRADVDLQKHPAAAAAAAAALSR